MKIFPGVLTLFFPIASFAGCIDLSYKMPYFSAEIRAKRINCGKLIFQQFQRGNAVGDSWEIVLSDAFKQDHVDDEYETFDRWDRRFLSLDGKSLVHENLIDSVMKADGSKTFRSLIETIYFDAEGKMKLKSDSLRREMKRDQAPIVKYTTEEIELQPNP